LPSRELFYNFFERRVCLSHDFVQSSGLDSGFLQLLVRLARFNGLVLACVANEQHAIVFLQPVEEFIHLSRARQARFVQDVKPFPFVVSLIALGKVSLQRV
jgi:hypothetical protein